MQLKDTDVKKILKNQSKELVRLKENLTWEDLVKFQLSLPDLPAIWLEESHKRYYPFAKECAHIIGYVSAPSKKDLEEQEISKTPGLVIGKQGIEKTQEALLKGVSGFKQVEVNAKGQAVRDLGQFPSIKGQKIQLAIHLDLQRYAYARLKEVGTGACVVMDNATGEILSFVSVPGYDTNLFCQKLSKKDWEELVNDPHHPLLNKVTSGVYPPGSVFKPIVALAALEAGVINPTQTFFCSGKLSLGGRDFHCWKKTGHGAVSLIPAMRESCDVYFFHTAALVGVDAIATMAKKFGFHQKTGVELSYEKEGLIPTRSWKRVLMNKPWLLGETYNTGIGQGYVGTTLLQLAVMTARLTNGGRQISPTLFKKEDMLSHASSIQLDEKHLKDVLEGMVQVVNHPLGTAYGSRILESGFAMGGKTGTAQVRAISKKERALGQADSRHWEWKKRDHALFVGFAPVEKPRYVVAVLIEHGASGSRVSGPIARDILLYTQKIMRH